MPLHNIITQRKPRTRTVAGGFCREKRLKYLLQNLSRYSIAIVPDMSITGRVRSVFFSRERISMVTALLVDSMQYSKCLVAQNGMIVVIICIPHPNFHRHAGDIRFLCYRHGIPTGLKCIFISLHFTSRLPNHRIALTVLPIKPNLKVLIRTQRF